MRGRYLNIGLWVFFTAVLSCGRGGSQNYEGDPPVAEDPGRSSPLRNLDLTGRLVSEGPSDVVSGLLLYLLDHSVKNFEPVNLRPDGAFSLSLERFKEDHIYSLHVINQHYHHLGAIDFSPVLPGVQSTFTYRGGNGFDLGSIAISTTLTGEVDETSPMTARIGGGFSLLIETQADFLTYSQNLPFGEVEWVSELVVFDPAAIYHGYYRRDKNPELFARMLAMHSRTKVTVTPSVKDSITGVFAHEGGDWLVSSRLAAREDLYFNESPRWSDQSFTVPLEGDGVFRGRMHAGRLLVTGDMTLFGIDFKSGPRVIMPKMLELAFLEPPKVLAFNGTGTAPTAVNYASDTQDNGLIRPFCQQGAVTVDVRPPLDVYGNQIGPPTLDRIDVEVDYFDSSSGTSDMTIDPAPEQYVPSFAQAFTDQSPEGFARTWDPLRSIVTFKLAGIAAAPSYRLALWQELFPANFGDRSINKARLRIYFRSEKSRLQSAVALWMKKSPCTH